MSHSEFDRPEQNISVQHSNSITMKEKKVIGSVDPFQVFLLTYDILSPDSMVNFGVLFTSSLIEMFHRTNTLHGNDLPLSLLYRSDS